jgi:hypothetical protein
MACNITAGRLAQCAKNLGGLRNVYIINYDAAATWTINSSGNISAFTASTGYKFELLNGSTFEETITSSRDNGTTFYDQVLTLNLNTIDSATSGTVALLAKGRPRIIVEDNNNNYFFAGLERGCDVTGGTISRGAAMADKSGYSLTFSAIEKEPATFVSGSGGTSSATGILGAVGITVG